ncbi:MAG: hypothetical protein CMD92_02815 [Gammaproteobacteria bacterium]|nr:hypothetical protein [Gammaproteobacteria bacterium]|tara:strand:- start:27281 stop:29626 length:2346 start_codon:yes stop_codon:yes gene_type:complete
MGKVNYRIVTLVAALASSILCAIALAFLVTAVVEYRADDFFTASKTKDFTELGTCVETLTYDQLKALKYSDHDLGCKDDKESGNKRKVINTLRSTVHGVYYAFHHADALVDDGTGTKVPPSTIHSQWGEYLRVVMAAQVAHVLGKQTAFGFDLATFENVGLNYSTVYEALNVVAKMDVPASCDDIYGLSFDDISDDNRFVDTEWEAFIKGIRKGRLDDDEETKSTWPLQEFTINCPGEAQTLGTGYIPMGRANEDEPLTSEAVKYMYAHCVAQFQFASVGSHAWDGTYGIPLPGIEPGPFFHPYFSLDADGFNDTSSYNMRARMYLGQRFGFSIWAYVPMFLALCFLLGDAIVFFLSEAVMPLVLSEQYAFASTDLNNIRDSLVIASTTRSSRRRRLAIGYIAVIVAYVFYGLFIAAPWGFFYTNLPRPVCEKTDNSADPTVTSLGTEPDHGVPQIWWKGTKGGWKADWDATWYDLAALLTMLFVLILLPITTSSFARNLNASVNTGTSGRTTASQLVAAAKYVTNERQYRTLQKVWFPIMAIGILVTIVGQSISGARFGWAWAEGVVAQEVDDEGNLIFDEVALSEQVYDQTISTLAIVVAMGLVFAVVMQRHLVNGVGCFAAGLFGGWLVLVFLFCLPVMIYAANRSIFNEDAANKDCATFPRSSHEFDNDLCVSRFWTLIVGGSIFLLAVAVISVLGALEYAQALFALRKKAAVMRPTAQELDPIMRATGPGNVVQAPFTAGPRVTFANTDFQTKPKTTNEFLYGSKTNNLYAPPAHR